MPERYQDEIEEILKGIEETAPLPQPRGRRRQTPPEDLPSLQWEPEEPRDRSAPSARRWRTFSPGRVALAGVALLLCGALLPSLGLPLSWLLWVGLLTLAAAYLLFFLRPRGGANRGQYWRGRPVESSGPSLWRRATRWFK